MTLALIAVAVLGASPVAQKPKLAVPGIEAVGIDQKKADFFLEYLAQSLGDAGFDVITQRQMTAVIGLERQKQLLGCADSSSSCLAELAGALGADLLLVASVARIEGDFVFTLKIISAKDARTLSQRRTKISGESKALDWLSDAAAALAKETANARASAATTTTASEPTAVPPPSNPSPEAVTSATEPTVSSTAPSTTGGVRRFAWIPGAGGVALGAAGGIFFWQAQQTERSLRDGALDGQDAANAAARSGKSQLLAADVLFGAGAAALVAGGVMYALGGDSSEAPAVAISPSRGGAALVVCGSFR